MWSTLISFIVGSIVGYAVNEKMNYVKDVTKYSKDARWDGYKHLNRERLAMRNEHRDGTQEWLRKERLDRTINK